MDATSVSPAPVTMTIDSGPGEVIRGEMLQRDDIPVPTPAGYDIPPANFAPFGAEKWGWVGQEFSTSSD